MSNVTSFEPKLEFSVLGKRAETKLELGAKHSIFTNTGDSKTVPSISLRNRFNAFQSNYVVDTVGVVKQRIEDLESATEDALADSDTDEVISSFAIRQNFRNRVGSNAVVHLGQAFATARSSLETDIGSENYLLDAEYISTITKDGINLKLSAQYQSTHFENDEQSLQAFVQSFLVVPLTRSTVINLGIGRDWNEFADSVEPTQGGGAWMVGFTWLPRKNIKANIGYAKQFFGSSPRASLSYNARRSGVELNWTRNLRSSRTRQFVRQVEDLGSFNTFLDPLSVPVSFVQSQSFSLSPFFADQKLIDERLGINMYFNAAKTTFTSSVSYLSSTTFGDESDSSSDSLLYQIQANRKLGSTLSANLVASLIDKDSTTSSSESDDSEKTASISASVNWILK